MALRRLTQKILVTNKKRNVISVFVLAPHRKVITLVMKPADKISAVKLMIKERLGYPCAQQRLTIGSCRAVLRDESTLEENRVHDYSTIELFAGGSEAVACAVRILPADRFVQVRVPRGAEAATVREVKELVAREEGRACEALYLDEEIVADEVTLEECNVPENYLVWVQAPKPKLQPRVGDESNVTVFLPRRTGPGPLESEDGKSSAPRRESPNALKVVFNRPVPVVVEAAVVRPSVVTDYERNLALVLDENSRIQGELAQLRRHLQEEVALARGESRRIQDELTELQAESARQLARALDEKEGVEAELSELQGHLQKQLLANGKLESESLRMERELGVERERALCAICLERPRDTMIFSCLHFHFCAQCLEVHQKRSTNCPSCRGFISGKLTCNISLP